ncbi:MAG: hypothetical protein AMXMBFR59_37600 [Rhodanobacteraceae bacterium]
MPGITLADYEAVQCDTRESYAGPPLHAPVRIERPPGAGALMEYSPQDNAFVAVALTGDGSAAASVNLLVKALRSGHTPSGIPDRAPAEGSR